MKAVLILATLLALPCAARAAIRPVQAEIIVTDPGDAKQASLDLDIRDSAGKPAWRLACHGGGEVFMRCDLTPVGRGKAGDLGPRSQFTRCTAVRPVRGGP